MPSEVPLFGFYHGESILPPSKRKESMTIERLQEKYPLRYKLYSQAGAETETDGISPQAIARHLQMLNNLDEYITIHGKPGKDRVLREKQLAVFRDTHEFLETGETEGFIEAPTGFGKTVLFSEIIKATDQRTLVVVPSRILVEQTYQSLKRFNPSIDIGRYYGEKKERDKQVTVTTYQSLVISCGGVDPSDVDLLILDEVHQSLTDARIKAVEQFTNPVKLGFTATPEYTQDKRVASLLNNEIHTVTLKEAVKTGLLCSFSVYLAETDVDLSNVKINTNGDYNEHELEEAINIYSRNKSAVELYKKLNEEHSGLSKAVAYCVSIKHAKEVARVFNEANIRAETIWSDQDPNERRRIIEAYKRSEVKVLTNVNVLTEGFDDPQTALCLNLRPTLSKVVAKQRGGRVLRLDPNNPKKHAIIIDYLDRNENKRTFQVTFAQVAEAARIINPVIIDTDGVDTDGDTEGCDKNTDKVLIDKVESFNLEGLRVITNSQEVLRIVSELETQNLVQIKETDFSLSVTNLDKYLRGTQSFLLRLATEVHDELKEAHPGAFVYRYNNKMTIRVISTPEVAKSFLDLMVQKGAQRKQVLQEVQPSDFQLSAYKLSDIFEAKPGTISPVLERAIRALKIVKPNSVVKRSNSPAYSEVLTDPKDIELFKSVMARRGFILREQEEVPQIGPRDFCITETFLRRFFIGDRTRNVKIAREVIAAMRAEYPDITITKKSGVKRVQVIDDPQLIRSFINEMNERRIKVKQTLTLS